MRWDKSSPAPQRQGYLRRHSVSAPARPAKPARKPLRFGPRRILRALSAHALSAVFRFVPSIRSVTAGDDPQAASRHVAIYVSFDAGSKVADHVVAQVAALCDAGRRVTFITNSPHVSARDAERLLPHVRDFVHRRNIGHDFGAYKDGIMRLGNRDVIESLVLMNDSCVGPLGGLHRVEQAARASGADLYGITDSRSIRYHVQTYYLWLGPRALRASAFAAFWRKLLRVQPRNLVIENGEIALTQTLLGAGLSAAVLCPYNDVAKHAHLAAARTLANPDSTPAQREHAAWLSHAIASGDALNPTHACWDVLLTECGSPFVKRDVLRHPQAFPGLGIIEFEARQALLF